MKNVKVLLTLSFLMIAFYICFPLWVNLGLTPVGMAKYFFLVAFVGFILLVLATMKIVRISPPIISRGSYKLHVQILTAWVIGLFLYGLLRGNPFRNLVMESLVYAFFICFLILSRYDDLVEFLDKLLLVSFWVSLILIVCTLGRAGTAQWSGMLREQYLARGELAHQTSRMSASLGKDLRTLIDCWPLVFALAYFRTGKSVGRILGLATPLVFLVLQILTFKFRSEVALGLLQVAMVMLVVPILQRKLKLGTLFVVLVAMGIMFIWVSGTTQYGDLMERYQETGKTGWGPRVIESRALFMSMQPFDWFFGKGLGGHYTAVGFSFGTTFYEGQRVRFETHIGALYPVLKGGLLFCAFLGLFAMRMFGKKGRDWYANRFNLAAISILPVFLLSQIGIPAPTMSNFMYVVCVAFACARMATPVVQEEGVYMVINSPEELAELERRGYTLVQEPY